MWPIQLAFLIFTVCRIFLRSLTVCNTYSFLARSIQMIFSILLQYHISELLICRVQFSAIQSCTPTITLLVTGPKFQRNSIVVFGCTAVEVPNCFNTDKSNSRWDSVSRYSRMLDWPSNLLFSCKPTFWRRMFPEKLLTAKTLKYLPR
jgi:hypothetical protein